MMEWYSKCRVDSKEELTCENGWVTCPEAGRLLGINNFSILSNNEILTGYRNEMYESKLVNIGQIYHDDDLVSFAIERIIEDQNVKFAANRDALIMLGFFKPLKALRRLNRNKKNKFLKSFGFRYPDLADKYQREFEKQYKPRNICLLVSKTYLKL
jgi:hypothetical protein